ncbi:MAG: DsbC family protein [Proteobacteria bacterium]|nr:DsbC family protein [Pseudomonadota bacterium]MDA1332084.1 DsbC family protein [Pseudomonadota bacterium]
MYKCLLLFLIVVMGSANANEATLEDKLRDRFPTASIDSISETKILGLYEIVISGSIYYVDEDFTYLFDGELTELSSMRNVTSERASEIERAELKKVAVPFHELPFEMAIKRVYGTGEREFAYFADPNCGYCRKFDKETLGNITDATLYLFLYPVITAQSIPISKSIWCSANASGAWDAFIFDGIVPGGQGDCNNPIDQIVEFGKKMSVRATPTLFFSDGSRASGALSLEQLEARLTPAK